MNLYEVEISFNEAGEILQLKILKRPEVQVVFSEKSQTIGGVAGSLAARGCGQICRPVVLGSGNWVSVRPNADRADDRYALALGLMLFIARKHLWSLQY